MVDADVIHGSSTIDLLDSAWQHPTRNIRIEMRTKPLASIPQQAFAGLRTKPQFEVGGILLGHVLASGTEQTIVITSAEFVPASGALYNSSAADAQNLAAAFRRLMHAGGTPIGYFRSHLRDGLSLTDQEARFVREYFPDPHSLCLLIRPFEMGACMAGFFLSENGRLETQFTDFEVPIFAPEETAGISTPGIVRPRGDVSADTAHSMPRLSVPAPEPSTAKQEHAPARPSIPAVFLKSAAVTVLAAGIGAGVYLGAVHNRQSAHPAPAAVASVQSDIGLEVSRHSDGQLELRWDRAVLAPAGVQNAALTVLDGSERRVLAIDATQLREGKITYFPSGTDITFQISVTLDKNRSIAESIRVLLPSTSAARVNNAGISISSPRQRSAGPAAQHIAAPAPAPALDIPVQVAPAPRIVILPISPKRVTPPEIAVAAPVLPATTAADGAPDISKLVPPASVTLPPLRTRTVGGSYIEPQAVRKALPDVRSIPVALLVTKHNVQVLVKLDENGRVVTARALNDHGVVGQRCVAAAAHWAFQPATLDGRPIAVDYTITFDFGAIR